ncbi:MAG: transposase [Draconibacterium sp.]|nr:transposase [Draconibacterium sp.]
MLQNKDIAKIQEIKTLFKDSWIQPEFLSEHLKILKFSKTSKLFSAVKKSGIPFWDVMKLLLVLPFTSTKNINSLYNTKTAPTTVGEKDVYYRALANQKINWRNLLLLFVKRYLQVDKKFSQTKDNTKCLIFDDTEIAKTGRTIEGVSKIYSHVTQRFLFGYKLLVAGYWNGSVFIPVDFSFHRENKKNKTKKYGLSKKEIKNQKKTKRDPKLPVYKRFKELNSKKNEIIVQMFRRINQRKIEVDYILIDSWFTTMSLISKLLKINKKINIIGMYKYNSKLVIGNKEMTIKQLRKLKKKLKRSRSKRLYYMSYIGEMDGIKVKIFLTRKGINGAWHTIISTDTNLAFNRMIEIYNVRWTIEVFFKEAKQLLGLGKNQSTNFDVQVAQTTITMIQYLLVSLKYRMEAYETIGGLFKDIKQDYIEHKLNERLLLAIIEILAVLDLLTAGVDIEETISKLICYSDSLSFLRNNQDNVNITKLAA